MAISQKITILDYTFILWKGGLFMQQNKKYRPLPFWSWNDKLEQTKLMEQIHWMNDNGMGGFFMHARSGLQTEYLSEQWLQCIETCVQEAETLDMKAWVYDENGWPSGFAGGKLLEDEKNRDKYIEIKEGAYDENATVSYLLTEKNLVRVFKQDVEEGVYLNLYIRTSVSTADILNAEVVDWFIALTHETYKTRFGEEFSEKIEGFFTDEPQYYRWKTPFTNTVMKYWHEHYGEDILDNLGLLFVEKNGFRQFRYRYWKAMQHLMLHNFAEKIYNWCDENGVKLTGHYIEETSLGMQMMCCGGLMPFYEYEHIPGIDWLGKKTHTPIPAKQVGSVAAQLGKKQVLTESLACCGWDVTPSEIRRILGFQYANGVNMLCHHLVPYSERGVRKYDHPAHYSDINPWVKEHFKTFNDYYTRLGTLLGEGEQVVNVAMLHPMRSAYFNYKRESAGFAVEELDKDLLEACQMLSHRGIEFHFLDETLLEKYGFVEKNKIGCGKCTYDFLVLPLTYTMDKTTESLLHQYVENGGKVLLLKDKPTYVEANEYAYDYLRSNVTLEEIAHAQRYHVSDYQTDIYSTYRVYGDKEFLYVINNSESQVYVQTFDCGADVKSFVKIDLIENSEKKVPLTITLKPGEDALFCMSTEEVNDIPKLVLYTLQFANATILVKENYMVVDTISYSVDGKEYSKPWPCAALFQKLLKERYQGEIFFRYEFEIDKLPKEIYLRTEKSNDIAAWLNGTPLTEIVLAKEDYVNIYDITSLVHLGKNTYTIQVDWFENESVHYALFGENVTESLKNCIAYDTELQPIELVGQFGVYPRSGYSDDQYAHFVKGQDFYIGEMQERVTEPSTEGFPFLAGEMVLRQKVIFDTTDIMLRIVGDYQTAFVKINGKEAGKLFFEKELDISSVAVLGENEVEVRFLLSNRNLMGPHHFGGDKNSNVGPANFMLMGEWEEEQCIWYHNEFDIKKFNY